MSEPLKAYAGNRTPAAFAEVVRAYQGPVYNTALRVTGDAGAAEDICQSVFLGLLEGGIPADLASERAWVHRAAVNAALHWNRDAVNRLRREKGNPREGTALPPDEALARKELAGRALEALSGLPEDLRAAVSLKVLQGLSYAEASAALGAPAGTVVDRVRQGLEHLRVRFIALGLAVSMAELESALGATPPAPVPAPLARSLARLPALAKAGAVATAGAAAGTAASATVKASAVGALALGLGLLGGQRLARVQAPAPPPPVVPASSPKVPPEAASDLRALKSELEDAHTQVALMKKEVAEQDRVRQGLEARLAEARRGPVAASRPPAPEEEEDPEPEWKKKLRELLKQPVHYKFDGVPFKDCKEYLEVQGRVVINTDKLALDAVPGLDDTPIRLTSPETGMSLESALNYLTRAVNLKWTLRDESITITTEAAIHEKPDLRQYNIRDLLTAAAVDAKRYPGVTRPMTDAAYAEFIKKYVDASIWSDKENSIDFTNGQLIVTAPPETQKKIRMVLKGFREQLSHP